MMKFYAIQTKMSMQEVHKKLGFRDWIECVMSDFDENEEQIYMTSIYRIEDKSLSDYTVEELIHELSLRGINV